MKKRLYWQIERTLPDIIEVGKGTARVISGYCFHPDERVVGISLVIGGEEIAIKTINEPRHDVFLSHFGLDEKAHGLLSGFWGIVSIKPELAGAVHNTALKVTFESGQVEQIPIGERQFVEPVKNQLLAPMEASEDEPLIVICLATFSPDHKAFRRQMESIIAQTHKNWLCIVSDDASPMARYREIEEVCGSDPRIQLFRNKDNKGFFGNFETCLSRVPDAAEYVAMSDQDDYWYPDKLKLCLHEFDEQTSLVYSDMQIVEDDGNVVSPSYWVQRRNNFKEFDALLIANTITGAASLFRAGLLEHIRPFPERIGDGFHDHWIACVAMAAGKIRYIDRPLYDYFQYGTNVIGHCDFEPVTLRRRGRALFSWLGIIGKACYKRIRGSSEKGKFKRDVIQLRNRLIDIYNNEYRRLQLTSYCIRLRFPDMEVSNQRAISLFSGGPATILRLLRAHIRITLKRQTTNNAELRLLAAYLAYSLDKLVTPLFRRRIAIRHKNSRSVDAQNNASAVEFIERKMAPLSINCRSEEVQRINFIIPEIRFDSLFGGYIGKFNFARRLAEFGHRVRFLVVDECERGEAAGEENLRRFGGGMATSGRLEVVYCSDRSVVVGCNARDLVVATTWWTAYIADAMIKSLKRDSFLYLIQEYEPFTFPMGTYFMLAEQSYRLPHHALFSTELLQQYFQENEVGVYSGEARKKGREGAYFSNAVRRFRVERKRIQHRQCRRLLFYARSDAHTARNMFEIGVMALRQAIEAGYFDHEDWEFTAAGTTYGAMALPKGKTLQMIGKLGLQTYHDLLLECDLGLSLMYTPHPSLVPLEMAAAGMIVVTNTCMNKSAEKISTISTNIMAGEPTVRGLAKNLGKAAHLVKDIDRRVDGAKLNWPANWDEAFSDQLIETILSWFSERRLSEHALAR